MKQKLLMDLVLDYFIQILTCVKGQSYHTEFIKGDEDTTSPPFQNSDFW